MQQFISACYRNAVTGSAPVFGLVEETREVERFRRTPGFSASQLARKIIINSPRSTNSVACGSVSGHA
jgi:hypothetical protein